MEQLFSIIQTTLISSVVAILVTEFLKVRRDKMLYKMEIQKEPIKRRIEAYDQLEHIIADLSLVLGQDNGMCYHFIFVRKTTYKTFITDVATSLKYHLWYSQEIIDLLGELNHVANCIVEPGYEFEDTPKFYKEKIQDGIAMYKPICEIKEKLIAQMGSDLKEMHKLDFDGLFPKK